VAARNGGRAGVAALITIIALGLGLRLGYAIDGRDYQPPDARVYDQIAVNLSDEGDFSARGPEVPPIHQPASAYSPGLPLFLGAVYEIGGESPRLARILLALIGAAVVPLTYLLGRRLAGPAAGLLGAAAIAVYPALLEYQGLLLTEPLAAFLLAAAVLAFLGAGNGPGLLWWIAAGALLGALSLVRAEYLPVAVLLPGLALVRRRRWGLRSAAAPPLAMLAATVLVLAPWTIRNAIELDRFVPVSTGGGKALYIGTYLEADGDGPKLRDLLLDRQPRLRARLARTGPPDDPNRFVLELLLARVAERVHPELEPDAALARLGRSNLGDAVSERPGDLISMLADKAYDTWTEPARGVMDLAPWRALQLGLLVLALAGLGALALDRRFEALVLGSILGYATAVAALLIASPRRALVPLPLVAALAGAGVVWLVLWFRQRSARPPGLGAWPPRPRDPSAEPW
jgi:Dolichyl-phosphate-mannose-protein mannosyltransferase